ncbi:MAG: universal stress protein [Oxalobacteraceae bacterium]|nr:universal stress protein [Oxalobacteraceae bacterium]
MRAVQCAAIPHSLIDGTPMFRTILIAYDGTRDTYCAVRRGLQLPSNSETRIHLLCVVERTLFEHLAEFFQLSDPRKDAHPELQRLNSKLDTAVDDLKSFHEHVSKHLKFGDPLEEIEKMIRELHPDLIIVGHSKKIPRVAGLGGKMIDIRLAERVHCNLLIASD